MILRKQKNWVAKIINKKTNGKNSQKTIENQLKQDNVQKLKEKIVKFVKQNNKEREKLQTYDLVAQIVKEIVSGSLTNFDSDQRAEKILMNLDADKNIKKEREKLQTYDLVAQIVKEIVSGSLTNFDSDQRAEKILMNLDADKNIKKEREKLQTYDLVAQIVKEIVSRSLRDLKANNLNDELGNIINIKKKLDQLYAFQDIQISDEEIEKLDEDLTKEENEGKNTILDLFSKFFQSAWSAGVIIGTAAAVIGLGYVTYLGFKFYQQIKIWKKLIEDLKKIWDKIINFFDMKKICSGIWEIFLQIFGKFPKDLKNAILLNIDFALYWDMCSSIQDQILTIYEKQKPDQQIDEDSSDFEGGDHIKNQVFLKKKKIVHIR